MFEDATGAANADAAAQPTGAYAEEVAAPALNEKKKSVKHKKKKQKQAAQLD